MKFEVTIISPEQQLYQGQADELAVPGEEGGMTLLAHHAPLLAPLKKGTIVLRNGSEKKEFPVTAGFIEISKKAGAAGSDPGAISRFVNLLIKQP